MKKTFIGIIYQCLQTEGEKNVKGSYFTPQYITDNIIKDIEFDRNDKVLDPCCGSGGFTGVFSLTRLQFIK